MAVLSALLKLRLVATLLIATIGMQAVPAGAIVAADRGPAFSASSVDVAIAVRSEPSTTPRMAPVPVLPPQLVELPLVIRDIVVRQWTVRNPGAPVRGPPRRALPSPREPPAF